MNIRPKKNHKKLMWLCLLTVVFCLLVAGSILLIYIQTMYTFPSRPPYIYKGGITHGSCYDKVNNISTDAGNGNWEIEYILTIHDGSPIEVNKYHLSEPISYSETNDIGQIRLKPTKRCSYVDDIVSVYYQVDWGKVEPFYGGGNLDIESGLFFWEDGTPVFDGYGYRNDVRKHRTVSCKLNINLRSGWHVTEWADLHLQRVKR